MKAAFRIPELRSSWIAVPLLAACASAPREAPPAAPPELAPPVAVAAPTAPRSAVRLALGEPQTIGEVELLLEGYGVERIEADPEGHYAGGVGATVRLRIAGAEVVLTELPAGYESAPVAWTESYRLELVGHGADGKGWAELHIDRLEPGKATWRIETRRGEAVPLAHGISVKLIGHSHKIVSENMVSPLLVSLAFERDGKLIDEQHLSLDPPDQATWRWRELQMRLIEHDYNRRMLVEVTPLVRHPLPP